MEPRRARERRQHARFPARGTFKGALLPHWGAGKRPAISYGRLQDVSRGGLCVLTDRPPKELALVQGELRFSDIPVALPTLLQVRWMEKRPGRDGYQVGLQFFFASRTH